MPIINPTLPNDGETADAADLTIPILAILGVLNGGLDADNLATGAVTTVKIGDGQVTAAKLADDAAAAWKGISETVGTITALGNRSYSVVYSGVDLTSRLSKGMRYRLTRTVSAPYRCTSLNGTTQYYSKSSPSGMTFTNNFSVSAWIKLSSYAQGGIISRHNGTSGWLFYVAGDGRVGLQGLNGGGANISYVLSLPSVPLNRWVHVTAQLDMSTFTATPTTSYVMIDGIDVPAQVLRGGTNPTALIQAGNLEVGSFNGGTSPFPGKIAQAAVYSAKVTQATHLAAMNQGLSGSETNLISAYSFDNSINDLNTGNANNLTASGSAVATNADSPFAQAATAGLLEYGIVTNVAFSTNTTVTVQVPEGSALPTSGGANASAYSSARAPYGFPTQKNKWTVFTLVRSNPNNVTIGSTLTWYSGVLNLSIPIGAWDIGYSGTVRFDSSVSGARSTFVLLAPATPVVADIADELTSRYYVPAAFTTINSYGRRKSVELTAQTLYSLWGLIDSSTGTETWALYGGQGGVIIAAENAYL